MRLTGATSAVALILALLPAPASACGACVASLLEPIFPPASMWSYIGLAAFLSVCVFARPPADSILGCNFHPVSVLFLSVGAFVATAFFGPLPLLVLLGVSVYAMWRGWRSRSVPRRRIAMVAIPLLLLLAVTGVYTTIESLRREDVAYILRWSGTGGSRNRMEKLKQTGDLASIRRIVQSDDEFETMIAAEVLAKLGDRATDGPLLVEALRRREAANPSSWTISRLQDALQKLLGQVPPGGKTAADWEKLL